jgi:hypothetical protein
VAHRDCPGAAGEAGRPAGIGDGHGPGMVGGVACAVASEQLVLGVRPSAADLRGHDDLRPRDGGAGREDSHLAGQRPGRGSVVVLLDRINRADLGGAGWGDDRDCWRAALASAR